MASFYALSPKRVGLARPKQAERSEEFRLPVRAVLVKAHTDRRNSFWQPAMDGTLEPLWEFQRARHRLRDERRLHFGQVIRFLAISEGK
jgi:hypothetical protein